MSAGRSALDEAASAAEAARVLERKAAYARQRAERFAQGAVGERMVAEALAPLTVDGWTVLHDRCVPHLGNLDHLAVGPGGVVVLDAKHWVSTVTVDRGLRAGTRSTSAVSAMAALTDEVRRVLVAQSLVVPVRGLVVLTHDRNAALPHAVVDGVHVVGLRGLRPLIASADRVADRPTVEDAVRRRRSPSRRREPRRRRRSPPPRWSVPTSPVCTTGPT